MGEKYILGNHLQGNPEPGYLRLYLGKAAQYIFLIFILLPAVGFCG